MAVVFVGALNVSSISTFAHGEIASGARATLARGDAACRCARRGDRPFQHGLDRRRAVRRGARSRSRPAVPTAPPCAWGKPRRVRARLTAVSYERGASLGRIAATRRDARARSALSSPRAACSRSRRRRSRAAGVTDPASRASTANAAQPRRRTALPAHLARVCDEAAARRGQRRHLPALPRVSRRRARPLASTGVHDARVVSPGLGRAATDGRGRGACRRSVRGRAAERSENRASA